MTKTVSRTAVVAVASFAAGYACCAWWSQRAHEPLGRLLQEGHDDSIPRDSCWLEKRRSKAGAEEPITTAFHRLHTRLFLEQLLPVSAFGSKRPGPPAHALRAYIGRSAKYSRGADGVTEFTQRATSRLAFVRFLGRQMESLGPQVAAAAAAANRTVRCLEWDSQWYLAQYATCQETWAFVFSARATKVFPNHRQLLGDLLKLPEQHPSFVGSFSIIFCNQVFEHVARPWVAATSLAAMLRPGGYLIWSAPFLEPTHAVPFDFFRYTISGGTALFNDAGLTVVATERGGDSMLTSSCALGAWTVSRRV